MSNEFAAATEQFEKDHSSPSPDTNQSTNESNGNQTSQEQAQALHEIDKLERFKYQGKEWTPKDLEKAILRQKDYTTKTQSLAEDRKSFDNDRKYYENLSWDIQKVVANPNLVRQFIETYPQKFHTYLKEALLDTTERQGQTQQQQQARPQVDVELLSRVNSLEATLNEQKTNENEQQVKSMVDKMSKKYPDALPDLALARAFDMHSEGVKLTEDIWDKCFKQSADQIQNLLKTRYGALVKKQTEANSRSRADGVGGGTSGQAPKKFNSLREVTNHAIQELTGKE